MGSGFSLQAAFWYQNAMLALFLHGKKSLRYSPSPELSENKFQFFFCTRPEILPFCTLDFVVATIVAMVIFFTVFAARAPAMGNSADRAWQLSQLVEGVLTACNPSHGSLSCVKTNCVSFASAQARKLNRSVCFSFPHEVGYFVGTPFIARRCVSKQIGRDAACQDCPRGVSRSPEAHCFWVVARTVRFSQPAVLSTLLVIQLFGIVIPPIFLLKSTKRSAAAIFGRSAPSLRFMVRFGIFCCRQDFLLCSI